MVAPLFLFLFPLEAGEVEVLVLVLAFFGEEEWEGDCSNTKAKFLCYYIWLGALKYQKKQSVPPKHQSLV